MSSAGTFINCMGGACLEIHRSSRLYILYNIMIRPVRGYTFCELIIGGGQSIEKLSCPKTLWRLSSNARHYSHYPMEVSVYFPFQGPPIKGFRRVTADDVSSHWEATKLVALTSRTLSLKW